MVDWTSSFEGFRGLPEEFTAVGADLVVVLWADALVEHEQHRGVGSFALLGRNGELGHEIDLPC